MKHQRWSRLETYRSTVTACVSPRRGGSNKTRLITNAIMTPSNREFCILSDHYAVAALNARMRRRRKLPVDGQIPKEEPLWPNL